MFILRTAIDSKAASEESALLIVECYGEVDTITATARNFAQKGGGVAEAYAPGTWWVPIIAVRVPLPESGAVARTIDLARDLFLELASDPRQIP